MPLFLGIGQYRQCPTPGPGPCPCDLKYGLGINLETLLAFPEVLILRLGKARLLIGQFEQSRRNEVFLHSFGKTSKLGLRICELIKVS